MSHLLTTKEAADYLSLRTRTLEVYRSQGRGPRYLKDQDTGAIRYLQEDLDAYRFDINRATPVNPQEDT